MKQTLYYLSGYNNYYNRQVKKPTTNNVSDYIPWAVITTNPTNFNPNDGVNTTMDVNYTNGLDDDIDLDYMVTSEDNMTVSSRWFVLERKRNLAGQWRVTLRRDLFADYYNDIMNSPVFIEKAPLALTNKLIFNKENGINYNQIKQSESLLMDETQSGWLVGYLATDHGEKQINVSTADKSFPLPPISLATIRSYSNPWIAGTGTSSITYIGSRYIAGTNGEAWWIPLYLDGRVSGVMIDVNDSYQKLFGGVYGPNASTIHSAGAALGAQVAARSSELADAMSAAVIAQTSGSYIDSNTFNTLNDMSGATFTDADGTSFKISVTISKSIATPEMTVTPSTGRLYTLMDEIFNAAEVGTSNNGSIPSFYARVWTNRITISIETVAIAADCVIKPSTTTLDDAPYKMFAIPAGDISVILPSGTFTNNINVSRRIASRMATEYGGLGGTTSFIYDLQLLPYCPFRAVVSGTKSIDVTSVTANTEYTIVNVDSGTPASIILWCSQSNFNFSIEHKIEVPTSSVDFKIDNETKFVRLCSPNYSGTFEFKPTMNYGVDRFEINCTYKPFQPYIHVSPVFTSQGLYGGNYDDQRGLVCTGDFSVPVKNDAWVNYQIQNKSYADSFNRQIENMQTNYDINRKQQVTAGTIGAISAGLSGATSGALAGSVAGPWGALAGGIAGAAGGAISSTVGLQADLKAMDALHQEAQSFAKDMWGYQLQNIQALPYTLGRVGAFNINNKIFPFLEFYDASDEEREALRDKIMYNGMTVMTIGKLSDYIINSEYPAGHTFVQGQLIRYQLYNDSSLSIDYHLAAEIASELHKGVYI